MKVGWFCNGCGNEVEEVHYILRSAGGGSMGSTRFEHLVASDCREQWATVLEKK